MDRTRALVYGTVALLVVVTLASGPLFDAVDLVRSEEQFAPGTGDATVTVVDVPDSALIVKGRYGEGNYFLRSRAATVDIEAIERQPMLIYKVRVPDLGYVRSTVYFLDGERTGRQRITLEEGVVDPESLDRDSYPGELLLLVRSGDGDRAVHRGNITVSVRR